MERQGGKKPTGVSPTEELGEGGALFSVEPPPPPSLSHLAMQVGPHEAEFSS